jgi:homoserine O-acetyltransferase
VATGGLPGDRAPHAADATPDTRSGPPTCASPGTPPAGAPGRLVGARGDGLAAGRHPPLQPDWIDAPHHHVRLGDLPLESGAAIRDCTVSYVVHGPQRAPGIPDRDVPVVLVLPAIASTHHRLDFLVGAGRALDPARFAIVAVDAIGNGLATSPSNSSTQPGDAFPAFTIRDLVASQAALLDAIGVGPLHAVVGASMGGMQALQWAVSFPDRVARVAAMTPMARTSPWAIAVNECARRALAVGGPRSWDAWVPLMQLLAGRTPARLDADFAGPADTIDWIERRTDWWARQGVAPIDWVVQSRAYDAHDVGGTPGHGGDTAAALRSIRARTLVAAPPLDLYNPAQSARDAAALVPGARFVALDTDWGHQSASAADATSAARLDTEIARLLAQ